MSRFVSAFVAGAFIITNVFAAVAARADDGRYPTSILPDVNYPGSYAYAEVNSFYAPLFDIPQAKSTFEIKTRPDGSKVLACETGNVTYAANGASGTARAGLVSENPFSVPKMQAFVEAFGPPAITEEDDTRPYGDMTSAAKVQFEDQINGATEGMTAAGLKLRFHADMISSLNTYNGGLHAGADLVFDLRYGDQHVHKIFSRTGTYADDGTGVFDSYELVSDWHHTAEGTLTLPPASLIGGTNLHMTLEVVVGAENDTVDGPAHTMIDATHTVEILGLIPYDAAGHVLSPDAAAFTSASGFTYPVLADVPEPAGVSVVAVAALALVPRGGRLRRPRGV
jgi:hypothetical protein